MIRKVQRAALDEAKYNACVEEAMQSSIFGFSWYLDQVVEQWEVLVLDDYEAVMPIPKRRKWFISYVYPPLWLIQLGIFSKVAVDENEFLIALFDDYRFVELRLNAGNHPSFFKEYQKDKTLQILSLSPSYEALLAKYNRNRKRELQKAVKHDLTEKWSDSPHALIQLFEKNVGKRVRHIKAEDYQRLLRLIQHCLAEKKGELLTVYDKDNELVAGAFFLKHKKRVTELVCSSDFSNRKNGANAFMNDRAIFRYQKHFDVFDFGGSSMPGIAKYYKSFGAKDEHYYQLHYNELPKLLKLVKS